MQSLNRKKRFHWLRVLALLICLPVLMAQGKPVTQVISHVPMPFTVLAEPQLTLPLTEITRSYSLKKGLSFLTAFDDSRSQFYKLLDGESGDVIITSMPFVMTELRQRGMVDVYTQTVAARDALVLATAHDGVDTPRQLINLLKEEPILLADARFIEGEFGQETLRYLFYDKNPPFPPQYYATRNRLYDALRKQAGVAILLQSQISEVEGITLTVPIAENSYPPLVYQAMAIAGENMPLAREFIEYLKSSEAQAIFRKYGFMPR